MWDDIIILKPSTIRVEDSELNIFYFLSDFYFILLLYFIFWT